MVALRVFWCLFLLLAPWCSCCWAFRLFQPSQQDEGREVISSCAQPPEPINKATALHVIGDSHGDTNFLVRSLLSTELFVLIGDPPVKGIEDSTEVSLKWKEELDPAAAFEVVILGDMVDRGLNSKKNLLLLKSLSDAKPFGSHMHVLLGNHEIMTLNYQMSFWKSHGLGDIYMRGDWTEKDRKEALRSTNGADHDLMAWLRKRKVAHLANGVLLMHGGLSERILYNALTYPDDSYAKVCAVDANSSDCGIALVDYFNREANAYFESLHTCIATAKPASFGKAHLGFKNMFDSRHRAIDCHKIIPEPSFLHGYDGLAFDRGFSSIEHGAGSRNACDMANRVGETIGVRLMLVAHTTHAYILEYCNPCHDPSNHVPIIVTDTHRLDCAESGECDFDPSIQFHDGSIDRTRTMVPQSVRIQQASQGTYLRESCLSHVTAKIVEVECEQTWGTDGRKVFNVTKLSPRKQIAKKRSAKKRSAFNRREGLQTPPTPTEWTKLETLRE